MGGTCASRVLSSACDVLEMNVVSDVGGVCDMCMCLVRGGVGGEWVSGLGLGFTNPGGTGGTRDMCVCFGCGGVGGVERSGWVDWSRVLEGGVVLNLCLLCVCTICVDGKSRYLYIVHGGYLRIFGAPRFNPVVPYRYLLPNLYLSVAYIANPDLFPCVCRTWICLDISRFYVEQYQPSSGFCMTGLSKTR